jgi:glutamate dehydrogenase/leucine dehydrogenase
MPMPMRPTTTVEQFFAHACTASGYDEVTYELLVMASREIHAEIPLHRDDGSVSVFNAFRVQHHNARGAYKDGLRYHPRSGSGRVAFAGVSPDAQGGAGRCALRRRQGRPRP